MVRETARRILSRVGYQVLLAGSGEEAVALLRAHAGRVDLLLTDVVMPGMNGRELAETLLPLRAGLKVLFTSGYTEDVVLRHGVREDQLAFLSKPYTAEALVAKVRETLGDHR